MASNMAVEAPTFHSLNKPQKRALMLRDRLRYIDNKHLESFISSLSENEPPNYKRINGTVQPPLVLAILKPTAIRYDLGNVHFDSNEHGPPGIYRAYLTVEDGSFELRTEDAIPADEANLESVPIHIFIAKTMVSMFETKFKAIWTRMKQINDIRQVAFDMAGKTQEQEQFRAGETLARLNSERPAQDGSPSQSQKAKKRRPGEPVVKHSSNKRNRVGLDTIPQDAKTATFNAIPSQIKVDLFNNVVKTAFPNFDNLMMASWNVVSVYSNVGSDFPELHKSIVELKSVLQDFEESFGAKVARTDPKLRTDFAPPSQDRKNGVNDDQDEQGTPDRMQHDGTKDSSAAPANGTGNTSQQQDNIEGVSRFEEPEPEHTQLDIPPPRIMQMSQRHQNEEVEGDQQDVRRNSAIPSSPRFTPDRASASPAPSLTKRKREHSTESLESNSKSNSELQRRRDEFRNMKSSNTNTPSKRTSPALLLPQPPMQNLSRQLFPSNPSSEDEDQVPPNKPKSLKEMSAAELRVKYKKRKEELLATFGGNSNVPQQYRVQMQDLRKEVKKKEAEEKDEGAKRQEDEEDEEDDRCGDRNGTDGEVSGGVSERKTLGWGIGSPTKMPEWGGASEKKGPAMGGRGTGEMPNFLGKSMLGSKKPTGLAPIAPMMHTKNPSGGSNGSPNGKKRD